MLQITLLDDDRRAGSLLQTVMSRNESAVARTPFTLVMGVFPRLRRRDKLQVL